MDQEIIRRSDCQSHHHAGIDCGKHESGKLRRANFAAQRDGNQRRDEIDEFADNGEQAGDEFCLSDETCSAAGPDGSSFIDDISGERWRSGVARRRARTNGRSIFVANRQSGIVKVVLEAKRRGKFAPRWQSRVFGITLMISTVILKLPRCQTSPSSTQNYYAR